MAGRTFSICDFVGCSLKRVLMKSPLRRSCYNGLQARSMASATMKAWEIHEYGGLEKLKLNESAVIPTVKRPDDILVKVHATSTNPIDYRIVGGYGKSLFRNMRKAQGWLKNGSEFPLTVGKDFSGVVVSSGMSGKTDGFRTGDEVWGAMTIAGSGCFAEYAVLPASCISKKPAKLSHIEAASMPYVTITAWSALCTKAGLNHKNAKGKRVLILGGSGGVGTLAIQLAKAWGAHVVTTCPGDAIELVANLGADVVLDYKEKDAYTTLERTKGKGYDVIFDCIDDQPDVYMPLLKKYANAAYVSIVTSWLKNIESYGFPIGLSLMALSTGPQYLQYKIAGQNHFWSFARPSVAALKTVADLVNKDMVKPTVQHVFAFNELPAALKKLKDGGNRGKIVIEV